ncbi:phosphoglucosamine mutase [[Clostridium] nexile DSM 1787]|jgi:phosphoglucosamine mutase|nr:phosphoglucosamine mutase [[Clostridium] nexile DSM 1787]
MNRFGIKSVMMRKKDMGKYFGTDGFRGEANKNLTADHAYKIGRFLGWYYGELKHQSGDNAPARIVIGKDTRRSSYMFEYSLVGGLVASGADAYLLHVTTTPSVAYVARVDEFDCGIMISASHNPYYDNGIKLINGNGEKMDEDTISLVEAYLDGNLNVFGKDYAEIPYAHRDRIGCTVDYVSGRNRYVGYLISLGVYSFKGMKVGLDCANGSSWNIAKAVFDALGAKTYVINADPNGTNINTDAGSTHIEGLQKFVVEKGLDVGFAYDGDADRCLCVDEKGNVVDGDAILYVYGRYMKEREKLITNTVVTTVMSNFGLYKAFDELGIGYAKTAVGDKYVYEYMQKNGCRLGGEQSGHIIFSKYASTGDGILTSLKMMEVMMAKKKKMSQLTEDLHIYPQVLVNVKVKDKAVAQADKDVQDAVKKVVNALGDTGRILVRESGTEPLIRVMVEAETEEICKNYVDDVVSIINKKEAAR